MNLNRRINDIVAEEIHDGLSLEEVLSQIQDALTDAPVIYEQVRKSLDPNDPGNRADRAWENAQ